MRYRASRRASSTASATTRTTMPATDSQLQRGAVVHPTGGEPARAHEATAPPAQAYEDAVGGESHREHAGTAQPEDLVECSGDAHVLLLFSPVAWSLPNIEAAIRARRLLGALPLTGGDDRSPDPPSSRPSGPCGLPA